MNSLRNCRICKPAFPIKFQVCDFCRDDSLFIHREHCSFHLSLFWLQHFLAQGKKPVVCHFFCSLLSSSLNKIGEIFSFIGPETNFGFQMHQENSTSHRTTMEPKWRENYAFSSLTIFVFFVTVSFLLMSNAGRIYASAMTWEAIKVWKCRPFSAFLRVSFSLARTKRRHHESYCVNSTDA